MSQRERARNRLGSAGWDYLQEATGKKTRPSIDFKIDRLVLEGIPASERLRIADALSDELIRALTDRGLPDAPRASTVHDRLAGGSFALERGASGETTGRQIARSVYRSIGNMNSAPSARGRNSAKS